MKIKLVAIVLICVLLLSACQNEIKENSDISKVENELQEKKVQLETLQLKLDDVKKKLDEADEKYSLTIESLQDEIVILEEGYSNNDSDLASLNSKIDEYENILKTYDFQLESFKFQAAKQEVEVARNNQANGFIGYAQSLSNTKEVYCFLIEEDNIAYYSLTFLDHEAMQVKKSKVMLDSIENEFAHLYYRDAQTIILSHLSLQNLYPYYCVEVIDISNEDIKQSSYFDYGYETDEYEQYLQVENKANWLLSYSGYVYANTDENISAISDEKNKVSLLTLSSDQSKYAYISYSEPFDNENITIMGSKLDGSGEFTIDVPVFDSNIYSLSYVNNRYLYMVTHFNPSTSEINVIDTKTLEVVNRTLGTRFTSGLDGQLIYQEDEGHFGPKVSTSKILIGNELLYEADLIDTSFITYALSADKKYIAILEEDNEQQFLIYGQIDYENVTIIDISRKLVANVEGHLSIDEAYNIYAVNEYKNYMHNKENSVWEQVTVEKLDMSEYFDYLELKASSFTKLNLEHNDKTDLLSIQFMMINYKN